MPAKDCPHARRGEPNSHLASSPWIRRYPRSGSLLPDEGPKRPCPLESRVVQAAGASGSISVSPVLDAIAAGSQAGRRSVLGEQPTEVDSIQRELLDLPAGVSDAPPVGAARRPRGGVRQPQWPSPVRNHLRDGPTEECERRQRTGRRVPRSIFINGVVQTKDRSTVRMTFSAPTGSTGTGGGGGPPPRYRSSRTMPRCAPLGPRPRP